MSEQTHELPGHLPSVSAAEGTDLVALLEDRVTRLVERYRASLGVIEDLRTKLRERDRKLGELKTSNDRLGRARGEALDRLQSVIAEVERLEQRGEASA